MNIGKIVTSVTNKAYELMRKAPTTNIRILLTLAIVTGTAIKYWMHDTWIPDWQWLIFLAGMAGLDVWQHNNKRKTTWTPKEKAEAIVIQNGHAVADVELNTELESEDERG